MNMLNKQVNKKLWFTSPDFDICQHVQKLICQILSCLQLKNRIVVTQFDDDQWLQLKCLVPLFQQTSQVQDHTTINLSLKFNRSRAWATPGIFIKSNHLPIQSSFINIIEDLNWPQISSQSCLHALVSLIKSIDKYGLLQWWKKACKTNQQCNQQDINQQVNQKYQIQNYIKNQNNKIQMGQIIDKKIQFGLGNSQICQNLGYFGIKSKNSISYCQKQSNRNIIKQNLSNQNQLHKKRQQKWSYNQQLFNGYKKLAFMIGQNNSKDQINLKIQQCTVKNEKNLENNTLFLSRFSSFKPIESKILQNKQIKQDKQENKKNSSKQSKSTGFIPYKIFSQQNKNFSKVSKNLGSSKPDSKAESDSLAVKVQNQSANDHINSQQNEEKKTPKLPKPMNKNANLPKFLIRIFIKYVDRFKSLYVKKQYDKLYSECKKMKQWKKNDRRQHAFGLKHLKVFFQDVIEGFPDPALNRRVISKIINSYLLEQICQNSQIPQSHRVGYLVACRVYSIRCRNASLAGRIQSK